MGKNSRGGRLLLPYLIWSIVFIGIGIIRNGLDIKHMVYCLLSGKAAAPFYYIVVLLQLLVITPWLVKHRKTWMYIITPIYLVGVYAYNIITSKMPLFYETIFLAWLFFYLLGLDCRVGKFNKVIQKVRSWWIIIALTLSIGEAFLLLGFGCSTGFACSQIRFSSFAYAAVIALWLVKMEKMTERTILSRIGDCSYGLFFVHMIFMMIVTKILGIIGLDQIWILYWGFSFCLVSIMSIIVVVIGRRIIKNKSALKAIGFE